MSPSKNHIFICFFVILTDITQKYTLWKQSISSEGFFRKSSKNQTHLWHFVWGHNLFWRRDICGHFDVGLKKYCWEKVRFFITWIHTILFLPSNSMCLMVLILVELGVFVGDIDDCFDICYFFWKMHVILAIYVFTFIQKIGWKWIF